MVVNSAAALVEKWDAEKDLKLDPKKVAKSAANLVSLRAASMD